MKIKNLFLSFTLIFVTGLSNFIIAQNKDSAQSNRYIASLDLLSLSGGGPDIRFEVSLNERSSINMRVFAFEDDSLHATLGVLAYRIYPIQGLGNAPKGFYIGPRLYKGAINEISSGNGVWREVVRGIGVGVGTGYQFNFKFGLVVDLGIGFNFSDQVIQFDGDEADEGFAIWPHPNVGLGWKF